ncbi:MAG: HEAT repeat domain-containing protein [Acidobacteria bacterium]|nr:HEAT repeat domain-containing protein [Acidobacteriota bacterium]
MPGLTSNGNGGNDSTNSPASAMPERRPTPWPLIVVAVLLVVVPFFAWYGTWFGRTLSDEQIEQYLKDEKPRHVQHALAEIERRMQQHDKSVRRWHPQIVALAAHPVADVRQTAAWVMGGDTDANEFHETLLRLLDDAEPVVRWNAARSLVSFGDARSRRELLAMLRPFTVVAPVDGIALSVLGEGMPVRREAMLARVRQKGDELYELRSPVPGRIEKAFVKEGDQLSKEQEIFRLVPNDPAQVRDALIGLSFFGEAEDLPEIENYARGVEGMTDDVKQQAARTVEAVKRRSTEKR